MRTILEYQTDRLHKLENRRFFRASDEKLGDGYKLLAMMYRSQTKNYKKTRHYFKKAASYYKKANIIQSEIDIYDSLIRLANHYINGDDFYESIKNKYRRQEEQPQEKEDLYYEKDCDKYSIKLMKLYKQQHNYDKAVDILHDRATYYEKKGIIPLAITFYKLCITNSTVSLNNYGNLAVIKNKLALCYVKTYKYYKAQIIYDNLIGNAFISPLIHLADLWRVEHGLCAILSEINGNKPVEESEDSPWIHLANFLCAEHGLYAIVSEISGESSNSEEKIVSPPYDREHYNISGYYNIFVALRESIKNNDMRTLDYLLTKYQLSNWRSILLED